MFIKINYSFSLLIFFFNLFLAIKKNSKGIEIFDDFHAFLPLFSVIINKCALATTFRLSLTFSILVLYQRVFIVHILFCEYVYIYLCMINRFLEFYKKTC